MFVLLEREWWNDCSIYTTHAGLKGASWLAGAATHALDLEGPDDVGGQLLRVGQRDRHDPVAFGAAARPVLVTLDPGPLLQLGQHDDGGRPLLPHHPPEVGERLR